MSILQKLTLKNLRLNKVRTIVTIIGIMLSTALITVVAGIAASGLESVKQSEIRTGGDYDFYISGMMNQDAADKMSSDKDVQEVYTKNSLGVAKFSDSSSSFTPYLDITGLSANAFERGFGMTFSEGGAPKNSDEIAISPEFVRFSKKTYHAGDKLTLEIGQRYMLVPGEKTEDHPISSGDYYMMDSETFITKQKKTYTVSGILSNTANMINDFYSSACISVYTVSDLNAEPLAGDKEPGRIYVRLTDSAEWDYIAVIARIMGTEPSYVEQLSNYTLSEGGYQKLGEDLKKSGFDGVGELSIHTLLLNAKGIGLKAEDVSIMVGLIAIITLIIMVSSIFIIRNSFSISITEKTKLYGMLAATGCTPRQIRRNVYFEGLVLGLIGIPLGVGVGIGATAVLIVVCNTILGDMTNSLELVFCISLWGILLSVVTGAVTIFMSVLSSAARAARISPIEAIRSNTDIRISGKNKKKSYKTPRFVSGLFGIGGSIAWKNMKRSKKQYRATVISIIVSVAAYLTVYSFVDYNLTYIRNAFTGSPYNIDASVTMETTDQDEKNPDIIHYESLDSLATKYKKVAGMSTVDDYIVSFVSTTHSVVLEFKYSDTAEQNRSKDKFDFSIGREGDNCHMDTVVYAVDDHTFKKMCEEKGLNPKKNQKKAFFYNNTNSVVLEDNKTTSYNPLLNMDKIKELKVKVLGTNSEGVTVGKDKTIKIASETSYIPLASGPVESDYSCIYISLSYMKELYELNDQDYFFTRIAVNSNDPDQFEKDLTELSDSDDKLDIDYVYNYSQALREVNSLMLIVEIFVYGFIIAIALIGLTNIFNTITTNMRLRQKEFAVFRSIGMTNKEFNRMISLESLLYTVKSLLIGLPLGILGGFAVYQIYAVNTMGDDMPFIFPGLAVLISTLVVLCVVWVIMRFSIIKSKKQNIIETIRNDNI